MDAFNLNDAEGKTAGDLRRNLDAPLPAIELAAARVDTLGIDGRVVVPRHGAICAALDWSYQLLSQNEQTVFRRLGIFVGGFTLELARAVAADPDGDALNIADGVANLVMKSLITMNVSNGAVRFRLLETTRAYALTKLSESREADAVSRRHAAYFRALIDKARTSAIEDPSGAEYAPEIDNIRAALAWAFAPGGDPLMAVELAAASAPIWLRISLLNECRDLPGGRGCLPWMSHQQSVARGKRLAADR